MTDDATVAAAAGQIEERAGRLDVLVNNAGITGGAPQTPTTVDPATVRAAVETNVIGVIRVAALAALAAPLGVAADRQHVDSVGSLTLQTTPSAETGPIVRTPQQGAATAIRLATLPDDGPTGGFVDDAGAVPW